MATPRAQEECIRKAKAMRLPTLRNLLICNGMGSRKGAPEIPLPHWHCRIYGNVPILWHTAKVRDRRKPVRIDGVKAQCGRAVMRSGARFPV